MSINFYVSRLDNHINASITSSENAEEVRQDLISAGSDEEEVVAFFSVDSEAADAIAAIATVNIEQDGSIGQTIETIVTKAFKAGMAFKI